MDEYSPAYVAQTNELYVWKNIVEERLEGRVDSVREQVNKAGGNNKNRIIFMHLVALYFFLLICRTGLMEIYFSYFVSQPFYLFYIIIPKNSISDRLAKIPVSLRR